MGLIKEQNMLIMQRNVRILGVKLSRRDKVEQQGRTDKIYK